MASVAAASSVKTKRQAIWLNYAVDIGNRSPEAVYADKLKLCLNHRLRHCSSSSENAGRLIDMVDWLDIQAYQGHRFGWSKLHFSDPLVI